MMKRILYILLLLLCVVGVECNAENYPYRADYLWITNPNHSDWLYEVGEKSVVDVQLYKYGMPVDCTINYEIGNDMLESDANGSVRMKNGQCQITLGTRKTPGFRDLRLSAVVDGKTYQHHVKVGFSVDKILPYTKEPSDFMTFWKANIEKMRKSPLKYTLEDAPEYTTDKMTCHLLKLQTSGAHSIYGYLFIPKNKPKGSCPIVVCPPGAGVKTIKEPLRHRYYGEGGCIRLEMEIHGLDPRLPKEKFDELSKAFGGYLSFGIEDKDRYYMKDVYLSLVRSIDYLTTLPEWDGKNVVMQGGSQGGALSIIAAALDERVTLCVANHPALSDMMGYYEKGRTGGYPHFKREKGTLTPSVMNTLPYYDVVNFSRYVSAPVYLTWGYNDNTCPPTTSYAVWNTLKCPKESLITPINEHWTSDATEYGQYEWIMKHLK